MAKTFLEAWLDSTLGEPDEQIGNDSLGVLAPLTGSAGTEIHKGAFEDGSDLRPAKNAIFAENIQKTGKNSAAGDGGSDGANSKVDGGHGDSPSFDPTLPMETALSRL